MPEPQKLNQEEIRLKENRERQAYWRRWGCYLSNRQWGTVREDYSADGSAWDYFSFEQSHYRAYRWGEDGIAGISDNHQRLCFSLALWNGKDPFLKERLYGLTNSQGNHGEDVKEYYFHLDNTPTHSYMKFLYKYPQQAFPYQKLKQENQQRGLENKEFELLETGIFDDDRYFDVTIEYAKADAEDILIFIQITNHSPETATIHLLPTLWFRNIWSWGYDVAKPKLKIYEQTEEYSVIEAQHPDLGTRWLYCAQQPNLLFTENNTNYQKLSSQENQSPYVKDAFNQYLVEGEQNAVNPNQIGTKFAAYYSLEIAGHDTTAIQLRLCDRPDLDPPFGQPYNDVFQIRQQEADEFYRRVSPYKKSLAAQNIERQAFAGMLWNKQYYHYVIDTWLKGDPAFPKPPESRKEGKNSDWIHLHTDDVISMPDKWEYPYFAAWDLAFHMIPFAVIDPDFAKKQLDRLTREWYMHPNGQMPAYEWDFDGVNPPVHAWAAWRVYTIEQKIYGRSDKKFLEKVFQKLLLNFTWWVNQHDDDNNNVFQGGFLGLDNIGVFNRGGELPTGGKLSQSDGTSWMAMYCLDLLTIALELAQENDVYEDIATKFFEHFLYIVDAMNHMGTEGTNLWNEEDGFYYDVLHLPDGTNIDLKLRSLVGLIPLFAVTTIEQETLDKLPGFKKRVEWFINERPQLSQNIACMKGCDNNSRRLLAVVNEDRLRLLLEKMLDETEFLSDYGIRSVSKYHKEHPYTFETEDETHEVVYEPAESPTKMFGGNSNWRGPIWFPINYLLIESLQKFDYYYESDFKIECPTGSGNMMTLWEVASELERRLISIFLPQEDGTRAVYGDFDKFQTDENWQDLLLFNEYFHGDNGAGLGASHQTGWTGLVAKLIMQRSKYQ
ncbi:Mannosyl oligosaccharide glucosidase [Xenococcus sp. PCC 7305]|uniref:MGH1-like glycoside hydrolase domain-containing protein n=1 Tax=Xenococcus sp. PCC 7305 TaxID=102125 RepID=UPI0002AC0F3B|nr:mannosyl-oligosaccharide glucosidase [Xenococcus sp. PCC 7305]ELS04246.1 Mannosyl oligosaccharide glucosidase [Xenococcus sp. PCC 7305]